MMLGLITLGLKSSKRPRALVAGLIMLALTLAGVDADRPLLA